MGCLQIFWVNGKKANGPGQTDRQDSPSVSWCCILQPISQRIVNGLICPHESYCSAGWLLKVIRKFFIKHSKSFRWHLGDYEIFSIWRPVCSYGCVVGPAGVWGPAWRRPLPPFSLYKPVFNGPTLLPQEHTKIKVSPLTDPQMEKNYVFRNTRDAI